MDIESVMQLLNSGGIVVLLLLGIKLGLKGEIVSRAMLRQVVRIVLEEIADAENHEHD